MDFKGYPPPSAISCTPQTAMEADTKTENAVTLSWTSGKLLEPLARGCGGKRGVSSHAESLMVLMVFTVWTTKDIKKERGYFNFLFQGHKIGAGSSAILEQNRRFQLKKQTRNAAFSKTLTKERTAPITTTTGKIWEQKCSKNIV